MSNEREARRALMQSVHAISVLTGRDSVVLRNISSSGLSARMTCPSYVGERFEFDLPGIGVVGGVVRWVRQTLVGVQFDKPIDLARYDAARVDTAPERPIYVDVLLRDVGTGRRPGLEPRN